MSGRQLLTDLASWEIASKDIQSVDPDCSNIALGELLDAIDWNIRDRWRHEYLATIRDGLRLLSEARTKLGDPRLVSQQLLNLADVPQWKAHRALRFVVVARRRKLEERDCTQDRIETVVLIAKLAASFIDSACYVLKTNVKTYVAYFSRMASLLTPPAAGGTYAMPSDEIQLDDAGNAVYPEVGMGAESVYTKRISAMQSAKLPPSKAAPIAMVANPLCGWVEQSGGGENYDEWKDPRQCCLCHICGDDDAGFPDPTEHVLSEGNLEFSPLGRLLPMSDGYWVHTSCALWSSEVWEAPTDGLVNSMEKARSRGAQLKCFGCGRPGATVGCNKSNCPFNYHFPCAKLCGAVFTENQRVYCATHKISSLDILGKESFEHMKALFIAPEEKKSVVEKEFADNGHKELCVRVGALSVHSLGTIDPDSDKFHNENYITPHGYVATRVFWSYVQPRKRTVYVLKVIKSPLGRPHFVIIPSDDMTSPVQSSSLSSVYNSLIDRVRKVNMGHFSPSDLMSKLPVSRKTRKKAFGLNGPQVSLDGHRVRVANVYSLTQIRTVLRLWLGSHPQETGTQPRYRIGCCTALNVVAEVQILFFSAKYGCRVGFAEKARCRKSRTGIGEYKRMCPHRGYKSCCPEWGQRSHHKSIGP
jgi:hypothetical protein